LGGDGGFGGGKGDSRSDGTVPAGGGGAGFGGAIFNMGADSAHLGSGQATLINCTFFDNTAQGGNGDGFAASGTGLGGALFNLDGQVNLTNDTLASNGARSGGPEGGAVFNLAFGNDIYTGSPVAASLVLHNSILADSFNGVHDLSSVAINGTGSNTVTVSGSRNLIMTSEGPLAAGVIASTADPKLGPLQNNGGLTPTMLPLAGSPVLGAGDPVSAPSTDQRGLARPQGGPTDIGAVQVTGVGSPPPSPTPTMPTLHTPFLLSLFDQLLNAIRTLNADGTVTVTDSFLGLSVLVSTYSSAGDLVNVSFFGLDVTSLFK
jgi:hypothetical protein